LAGENFGEFQAKLHLAKKILADLSPASIAFSDITNNWQIKLWRIRSKPPNSPKFSSAKIFHCTVWECVNSGMDYWNGGILEWWNGKL